MASSEVRSSGAMGMGPAAVVPFLGTAELVSDMVKPDVGAAAGLIVLVVLHVEGEDAEPPGAAGDEIIVGVRVGGGIGVNGLDQTAGVEGERRWRRCRLIGSFWGGASQI